MWKIRSVVPRVKNYPAKCIKKKGSIINFVFLEFEFDTWKYMWINLRMLGVMHLFPLVNQWYYSHSLSSLNFKYSLFFVAKHQNFQLLARIYTSNFFQKLYSKMCLSSWNSRIVDMQIRNSFRQSKKINSEKLFLKKFFSDYSEIFYRYLYLTSWNCYLLHFMFAKLKF